MIVIIIIALNGTDLTILKEKSHIFNLQWFFLNIWAVWISPQVKYYFMFCFF